MMGRIWYGLIIGLILVTGVFFAGCSDNSSSGTVAAVPTTAAAAKYEAGDIVGKTMTQTEPLWLILGYDQYRDQYERALIYKNTDGTWGHRNDNRIETFSRQSMEKLYPVKVSHVTVSNVKIITPTAATPVPTTYSGSAPRITDVSPKTATKDSLVSLTITGSNFASGAQVRLIQAGYPSISATSVSASSSQITCMVNLKGFDTGATTVEVINPDGRYDTLSKVFTIGSVAPVISTVSPLTGSRGETLTLTITGSNFEDAVKVYLMYGSSELNCFNPKPTPPSKILCDLNIPAGATLGSYSLSVLNIDSQKTGTWSGTFTVTNATA